MRYQRPGELAQALDLLASGHWPVLAGGTDFYPALGASPVSGPVLDITAIDSMRGMTRDTGGWRIGALTTWSDIQRADLPAAFDGLKLAGAEVGSVQIQNTATIAGNLCNASPAADGIPPLLCLDASVELASSGQTRHMPLADFITGNRATQLAGNELVTAIIIPRAGARGVSSFIKLGARRYLVISIAMISARLELDSDGLITRAAIAAGACSAVARRLGLLEQDLTGLKPEALQPAAITPDHLAALSPIDDIRASADYRLQAVRELICRVVADCGTRASPGAP